MAADSRLAAAAGAGDTLLPPGTGYARNDAAAVAHSHIAAVAAGSDTAAAGSGHTAAAVAAGGGSLVAADTGFVVVGVGIPVAGRSLAAEGVVVGCSTVRLRELRIVVPGYTAPGEAGQSWSQCHSRLVRRMMNR